MKLVGIALAAFLAGCQFANWHILNNPGEDQVIRVENGDRYYFDLEENATTGYMWDYSCDNDDVEVTVEHKGPSKPGADGPTKCGAPGRASARIRIHRGFDGPAGVGFFYKRSGEKTPVKEFTVGLFRRTGDVAFWE